MTTVRSLLASRPAPALLTSMQQPLLAPQGDESRFTPARSQAAKGPGTLDLDSAQAKAAISASLRALNPAGSTVDSLATAFSPRQVFRDDLGMVHVRLDRLQDGLPLFGDQVIVHLGPDGAVQDIDQSGAPQLAQGAANPPALTGDDALTAVDRQSPITSTCEVSNELVYFKGADGKYRQAFHVAMENLGANTPKVHFFIDAQTGETVDRFAEPDGFFDAPQAEAAAQGVASQPAMGWDGAEASGTDAAAIANGTGSSLYLGQVPLTTRQNADGTFTLADDSRGGSVTKDAMDAPGSSSAKLIADNNNIWGEGTDSAREKAAIDAHFGMEMTWDFYKDLFGRNSIDDRGAALNSVVHMSSPTTGGGWNNARWTGREMQYGDGDGTTFSPLTAIDVTGHEITHGFTQNTSGLIYRDQSGGLNEAMSDIFGTGVRWYANQKDSSVPFSWNIGDMIFTPGKAGDALRYMEDPKKDNYSIDNLSLINSKVWPASDNGGVHGTSGIANNAFYLMVNGGTNHTSGLKVGAGIGMEKALKIMYRAQTVHFRPDTGFRDAGALVLKSAVELYGAGSPEAKAVEQAWTAVGCLGPTAQA